MGMGLVVRGSGAGAWGVRGLTGPASELGTGGTRPPRKTKKTFLSVRNH